jgi:arylsulfatase
MDVNVGKIIEYLQRTGEYDNTFIGSISDNGAEGSRMLTALLDDSDLRRVDRSTD